MSTTSNELMDTVGAVDVGDLHPVPRSTDSANEPAGATIRRGEDSAEGGVAFVDLARAVAFWRQVLGDEAVLVDHLCKPYESNCIGVVRSIPVALKPTSERQVQDILRIASECRVPLYPISTGKNWGYGSAVPASDRCVVVDLSSMDAISSFDSDLGLVTVQPGVTQGHLHAFLEKSGHAFMVPVTGAGPQCSLVGNALERGYGITPHADHFGAVRSIRAILPNGEIYGSALKEAGGGLVDACHKWGLGPYLDGIFSQSGFGIVTEMTIALAPLPERVEAFLVEITDEDALEPVIGHVRDLLQKAGGGISGINLMNRLRLLSMFHPYPREKVNAGQAIPKSLIEQIGKEAGLPRWMGLGALYGDKHVVAALRKSIRNRFGPHSRKIRFISKADTRIAGQVARLIPKRFNTKLARDAAMGSQLLDLLSGKPMETALRLAYWKAAPNEAMNSPLNPSRDGRGLVWFSPLVPMKADLARSFITLVNDICPRFGFDPLITLTSVSEQCFDSTVPLLFDPKRDLDRVHECYDALLEAAANLGLLPYRLSIQKMSTFANLSDSPYWSLVRRLKDTIDPNNIISPGRYAAKPIVP